MIQQRLERPKTAGPIRLLLRRVGRWIAAGLVGWLISVGGVVAQEPSAADSLASKAYLNKTNIQLPIVVDAASRAQLQAVQLFVREGASGTWAHKDTATPDQEFFMFRAPRDGEYWFNIVAIDRTGRRTPADVTKQAPALMVVIDSQAPVLDVALAGTIPEGQLVHCEVRDAYPDYLKTRFYFQTRDQVWRPLEPLPNRADLFCVPTQAALTGMIRITGFDQSGNSATREFNLSTLPARTESLAGNAQVAKETPAAGLRPRVAAEPEVQQPQQPQQVQQPQQPQQPPAVAVEKTFVSPYGVPTDPASPIVQNAPPIQTPVQVPSMPPTPAEPNVVTQPIHRVVNRAATTPGVVGTQPAAQTPLPAAAPAGAATQEMPIPANRRLTNQTRVMLDYQIEAKGPSGVGRIEVWATRDMGQSWQKIHDDVHRQSPLELNLPGEGLYGLTMTATNGRGIGAQPPKAGDAPETWVEVDTTRPNAQLTDIRLGSPEEGSAVHIRWSARDRNLGPQPIDLYYAASREGPWTPIARNLRNDGYYRWTPPNEAGNGAFIRLIVRDLAHNVALSETQQQVALGDQSRPKARILDIVPIAPIPVGEASAPAPLQVTSTPIDVPQIPRP